MMLYPNLLSRRKALERLSPRALGLLLAFAAALISGFSIWVNSYAVREVRDPAVFTTAKNAIVGAAFVAALLAARLPARARPPGRLPAAQIMGLVALGVVGGSIPFVLFFEGLSQAGPGNGAFIQKTLFIWVAILAVPLLAERLTLWHLFALGMLGAAQWFIGHPAAVTFGRGEAMVFAATLLWAVEVTVARRLLPEIGAGPGAAARMGLGAVVLFGYLALTGKLDDLAGLTPGQWQWVAGTAAILLVYVSAWYGALRLAPATVVTSVLALGAPITAFLSTTASGRPMPTSEQLIGYGLVAFAVALMAGLALRSREREALLAGAQPA